MNEAASAAHGGGRQSLRFLLLYALAAAGGAMAYMPFLTILLPVRVEAMAGGAEVTWLAYCSFSGAAAASLSNILFGWLSDRTGNRQGWIVTGLLGSCALLLAMPLADSLPALLGLLVAWQVMLNMMLGPLAALAGDYVPDRQKGFLGGLLSLSPAMGALAGAFVTFEGVAGADARLAIVAALVALCVLPVVLFGRPVSFPELTARVDRPIVSIPEKRPQVVVPCMWLARLLVQIAEAVLFAYLYVWFRTVSADFGDDDTAAVFGAVLVLAIPATLWVGRWADRNERPILPLAACAGLTAVALLLMASAESLTFAVAGYALFGLVTSMFLSLHSAQTLRVLPRPQTRGRDLGLFNLTNTVPSLIMPWLTLATVPAFGFSGLFMILAALSAIAALLLASISRTN
ncbi:MFS transporter [Aurantiacibacter gilvus]|uniref:MFS transporter n=1 Tax=Aurantiacibacter gilvus TaxID=3139141 RepID=A0ABU9IG32_9SPHN